MSKLTCNNCSSACCNELDCENDCDNCKEEMCEFGLIKPDDRGNEVKMEGASAKRNN